MPALPAAASSVLAVVIVLLASACERGAQSNSLLQTDTVAAGQRPIVVSTSAELIAALGAARPGSTVLVQPGAYEISNTLVIPDSVTLLGSGAMHLDSHGLPAGFDPPTRTLVKSTARLAGDVVRLGNRSIVRGLAIEDAAGRSSGSIVVIHSRSAGDFVSATLEDCEIVNPNEIGDSSAEGPIGRSVVATTPPPRSAASADSSARLGASVALRMSHCIVRSSRGTGVFAMNFAPRGRINFVLTENIIGGGLIASGAVSGGYAVSGASTVLESRGNVFRADSGARRTASGWLLSAVSTPSGAGVPASAGTKDTLYIRSTGDRIEGFQTAISACGALRLRRDAGMLAENVATLELQQTELKSVKSDFELTGARSLAAGGFSDSGNVLRLIPSGIIGSGSRENSYAATAGPPGASWLAGNRVEVLGSPEAFARANRRIIPAPARGFFDSSPDRARASIPSKAKTPPDEPFVR